MYLTLTKETPNNHMLTAGSRKRLDSGFRPIGPGRQSPLRIRYRNHRTHVSHPAWHYHPGFESLQGVGTAGKNKERPPSRKPRGALLALWHPNSWVSRREGSGRTPDMETKPPPGPLRVTLRRHKTTSLKEKGITDLIERDLCVPSPAAGQARQGKGKWDMILPSIGRHHHCIVLT